MRISVRVIPRGRRNSIAWEQDTLKVHLTAPPVDGAANSALITLLSERLDISRRAIRIIHGSTGRQKIIEIAGLTREMLRQKIARDTELS